MSVFPEMEGSGPREQSGLRRTTDSGTVLPVRSFATVNLDEAARRYAEVNGIDLSSEKSPFLDTKLCQRMVDELHGDLGVSWSFGGYLEDRSALWKGSYLEEKKAFIHLGIDVNVPRGTPVSVTELCRVVLVDDDRDHNGGWGPYVIVQPLDKSVDDRVVVYGHLQNPLVRAGDILAEGVKIAEVGAPPANGGWYDHLHIQSVEIGYFRELVANNLEQFDGYAPESMLDILPARYPDPFRFVNLKIMEQRAVPPVI